MTQQTQDPTLNKAALTNSNGQYPAFRQSPWPTVLAATSKVFYGLGGVTILASLGIWNRVALPKLPVRGAKKSAKLVSKPATREQHQESQRLGTFVGLWAPTFVITAKALDDASTRLARHEYAQWEKKQGEKARTAFRFFNR